MWNVKERGGANGSRVCNGKCRVFDNMLLVVQEGQCPLESNKTRRVNLCFHVRHNW